MTMEGGNTELYQGDGRLEMAVSLARSWPGKANGGTPLQTTSTGRGSTPPLELKAGVKLEALRASGPVEDGIVLNEVKPPSHPSSGN